jgi:hypothetical protein
MVQRVAILLLLERQLQKTQLVQEPTRWKHTVVAVVVLKQQEVMAALVVVGLVLILATQIETAVQETHHLLHQAKETMAVLGLYRIAQLLLMLLVAVVGLLLLVAMEQPEHQQVTVGMEQHQQFLVRP